MDNTESSESSIANELNVDRANNGDKSQDSQEEVDNIALQGDEEQREKLLRLPLGRVKTLIKMDPDINLVNQEAVFLIAKSAELFIDSLAKEAYKHTIQTKKRTVQKRDVENAIDKVDALVFLEGMLD